MKNHNPITVKITESVYIGLDERAAAVFLATTEGYTDGIKANPIFTKISGYTLTELDNAYLTGYHLGNISRGRAK